MDEGIAQLQVLARRIKFLYVLCVGLAAGAIVTSLFAIQMEDRKSAERQSEQVTTRNLTISPRQYSDRCFLVAGPDESGGSGEIVFNDAHHCNALHPHSRQSRYLKPGVDFSGEKPVLIVTATYGTVHDEVIWTSAGR